MRRILPLLLALMTANFLQAQASCSDLFFSEYIEGSSSNKALELYNPTSATIDLTDYVIYRNNNGSTTPTDSLFPQGTVLSGDVFVVANPSGSATILAQGDTTHSICFYNGDDAVWLKKISTGDTLDIIGQIGVDPGAGWIVGSGATNNNTLIRQISVLQGETDWILGSTQWDVFPIDMDDSLGAHTMLVGAVAVCQNISVFLDGAGNASIVASDIDGGSTGTCGPISLSASQTAFTCADIGANNVTLTVNNGPASDNCSAVVTVLDTVSPVVTCPGDQTEVPNASCQFTLPDYTSLGSASDNCAGSPVITQSPTAGTLITSNTVVTLTADDGNGNTSACTFEVILNETVLPTAVCQNINAYLDGSGNATITAADIDGGSADNCGAISLSASQTNFTCANLGSNNITLTVTDASSNTNSCVAVVTILDTVSPVVVCQNINLYLDGAGNATIVPSDINNGSSDNCGSLNLSVSQTAFSCADLGVNNVTLTANDGNGNVSSCSALVTVLDTISPTITCPSDQSENLDVNCQSNIGDYTALGSASDNCGATTITQSPAPGTSITVNTTVTLTADDGSGNTSSCTFQVMVNDVIPPNVLCQDVTAYLDASGNASITAFDIDGGSTDNCGPVILLAAPTNFTVADLGPNNVNLAAADASGNFLVCPAVVTVVDTISPMAVCQNIDVYLDASGNVSISASDVDGGSTDNSGTSNLTVSQTSFSCADLGANNITLTVDDGNGNSSSCIAIVTVIDTIQPMISCQSNITQNNDLGACGAIITYAAPVGTDNCPSVTIVQTSGLSSGSLFPVGTTTNTFEVTDAGGNTASCSFDVVVTDTEFPTIPCPANIAQDNDPGNCDAIVTYTAPVGVDNCPGSVTFQTAGLASGSAFPIGTTTNTFQVIDAAGNVLSCSFDVVITDAEFPTISCPANVVQNNDVGVCGATITFTDPVGTDNCPGETTAQTAGLASGSVFPIGTTTNTFEVTDASGNVATCSFDVVITDIEFPTIVCPNNILQNNDAGVCGAAVTYTAPIGADNCPSSTTVQTAGLPSGSIFPIGTTINTFEVTDASGNVTICSFNVVITDTENPTISCPANVAQDNDLGICGSVVNYTTPVGADNCPGATTVQIAGLSSGSVFPIGTTTNVFEVTDASGNTVSCSFDVVITDAEFPTISCPANIAQDNDAGVCGATVTYTTPVGADNCPGSTTTQTSGLTSGSLFPIGTTTNTFEVTDASGNVTTCSFDIVISDAEFPTIACQAGISQNNDAGLCGATIFFTPPVGTDNCAGSNTLQIAGLASSSIFPVGTTTNTFEVTDASGNVSTCSFDVTIIDSEFPAITCPADIAQNNDLGVCGATITFTDPIGTDNCPNPTTIQTTGLGSGSVFPIGITTNTFEVTDASGNVTTCSFDVVITDTEFPTIVCPANIAQNNDMGVCGATVNYTTPIGADNCPGEATIQIAGLASGSVFPIGTTTNTFEVTDASGNVTTCSFDVVITDTEFPTITCPADVAQNNDLGVCGATVTYTAPVGVDNCPISTTVQTAGLTSGALFPVGTTTNTFEVTDAAGNVTTCSFDVVVSDTEFPVIACPVDIAQDNDPGECGAIVTYTTPAGFDNCTGSITTQTTGLASGMLFPIGTTINTFEVIDAAGNVSTCSFEVTITDAELPVITCPGDIAQDNDLGECGAIVTYTAPVGTDNCPGSTTVQTAGLASGDLFPTGTTTNTFEVTDASGNVATCSFDVVITDSELPVITCSDSFESCDSVLTVDDPIVTDNCPNVVFELTSGLASGSIFPVGVTQNLYTTTDLSGNQATCIVEVTRFQLPTINAGDDLTVDAGKAVVINAISTNTSFYDWSPSDGLDMTTVEAPEASPMFTTDYIVRVESEDGCEAIDSVTVNVNLVIETNNFMSPNNDGKNDTWVIKGNYLLDDCNVKIYSSWGNLLYESEGYANDWDGTFKGEDLPAGTYYYVVSCGSDDPVTGSITLLR